MTAFAICHRLLYLLCVLHILPLTAAAVPDAAAAVSGSSPSARVNNAARDLAEDRAVAEVRLWFLNLYPFAGTVGWWLKRDGWAPFCCCRT